MPLAYDPYEWIDPEKGRQEKFSPQRLEPIPPALQPLRDITLTAISMHIPHAEIREILVKYANGAQQVSQVRADYIPSALRAMRALVEVYKICPTD